MYVSQLNKAASGSYELLHNLLDWALTQSGRLTVSGECIKVEKSVNEAFLSLNSHAALKGIELLNSTAPDTKVFCDLNMFSTVLRNLISNAIKFTPENGRVNISADKSETIVSIIVEDNGVGISEENLIGLFNIETHFSTRGTQNERGTGLGLIVCKEFVEKNNGSINVESKPGAGTRFIVTLPSC